MVGEEVRQEARPDREVGGEGGELGAEGHQGKQDGELEGEGGEGGEEAETPTQIIHQKLIIQSST